MWKLAKKEDFRNIFDKFLGFTLKEPQDWCFTHFMKTFWNWIYDWLQNRNCFFLILHWVSFPTKKNNNKELISKKYPFFLNSSLVIPYIVIWFNVWNKELLALRNSFRLTKKFLIAKFDCTFIFTFFSFLALFAVHIGKIENLMNFLQQFIMNWTWTLELT